MQQSPFYKQYKSEVDQFIHQALMEDIGGGDHTSLSCLSNSVLSRAQIISKQQGTIAGIELAELIFKKLNPLIQFQPMIAEGEAVKEGDCIVRIKGPQKDLLACERLVLNCLQRMSGIATITRNFTSKIKHTNCRLLDTRKTTPNFRYPEKWAVQIGGGCNHRMGLFDVLMIKDNHIDFNGSITSTLEKTQQYLTTNQLKLKVIVEVRKLSEIEECLNFPWIHRILLDNMSPVKVKKAVQFIDGRFSTEASGNISEKNLVEMAETGVDYLSLGALTHSAKIIDLSLKSIQ
jgi:nicotinate-nucleotide pyrophosphorylase (carboxylating)